MIWSAQKVVHLFGRTNQAEKVGQVAKGAVSPGRSGEQLNVS